MKLSKIILTGLLTVTLTGMSFANTTLHDSTVFASVDEENAPQEIKVSELPQAIKQSLKSEAYDGWEPSKAWMIKKQDKVIYQIEVVNEEESTTLLFDEDGAALG
ncbi:MAG TPA: hypothetical protein VKY37_04660 [Brumimicrobium sp.]|nr:hypothetical protein [Brumimicrobium sp.]